MKDLFRPGGKKISKSVKREQTENEASLGGATSDERKSFLKDPETGLLKEIRQRMRSGASSKRQTTTDASEVQSSLADQHAKRLKVAKSSRVTLGVDNKPPRVQKKR